MAGQSTVDGNAPNHTDPRVEVNPIAAVEPNPPPGQDY